MVSKSDLALCAIGDEYEFAEEGERETVCAIAEAVARLLMEVLRRRQRIRLMRIWNEQV